MATFFIILLSLFIFVYRYVKSHDNPYKLTFIFGKKGAGKSCYMVSLMLRYLKRGWNVYTDMEDIRIPGVRIITVNDLSLFRPAPHSAIFLDEVGISMDNRAFDKFPPGLRDFFKYLRKMQCCCYMNSQAYDVDKKVRDTVDRMILQVSVANLISISRPIARTITLTEPTSQAEARICDKLSFTNILTWRFFWMPNYYKYFNSKAMPAREMIPFVEPNNPIEIGKGVLHDVKSKVRNYLHWR